MDSFARSIFLACLFVIGTHGIRFNMEGQTKCFRDEVQANQLIALEFELEDVPGQQIDYVVSGTHSMHSHPLGLTFDKRCIHVDCGC